MIDLHSGGGGHRDEDQTNNIIVKSISLLVILMLTLLFGFLPYFWKTCRGSVKLLGVSNAFSGGIFLGIALFHLLPESCERIEGYVSKDSIWSKLPNSFFLAYLAYSLILFVEKIAFDSHSLIHHEHEDGHSHDHNKNSPNKEKLLSKDDEDDEDENIQEEVMKNVVSSKGKFASFLHMRNSIIGPNSERKQDSALKRASLILSKNFSKSFRDNDDMNLMVNPKNVHVDDHQNLPIESSSSLLTPLLLLTALSLHGFFEGMALGFQGGVRDSLFLATAILAHKWAEAFTLGISFTKAGTDKKTFLILIIIFSMFTPLGIILGLCFSGSNDLLEGIVLGLSTGTFIYVAASEVIVEEFAVTKHKFLKYLFFIIGGIFVGGLAMLERFTEDHDE